MRVLMRLGIVLALLLIGAGTLRGQARSQATESVDPALRHRVERHFQVLPVRGGVVLTPRRTSDVKSIEIRDGLIALNGDPATGAELRKRLGEDAELVLQVSYVPSDVLAHWGRPAPPAAPGADQTVAPAPGAPESPEPPSLPAPPPPPDDEQMRNHRHRSASRVHIGGDITVGEDEIITDPVVAIGGSVNVLGHVNDDVVAIGGGVHLGPKAVVTGNITTVGGHVEREPGSSVDGGVNEVRIGPPNFALHAPAFFGMFGGWNTVHSWLRLVATTIRLGIVMLLVILVTLVAARPVERIGERAAREPWLSGFTGLLAQLLFVPVLVLTVVVLAVSIIGIPLLVLVPFGILAFLLAVLVGFSGVALRIGRWAVGSDRAVPLALAVGVILVASIALVARGLALVPAPLWPITWIVGAIGFFTEYVAWTVGLGAALLTRFGSRGAPYDMPPPLPPLPTFSGPASV